MNDKKLIDTFENISNFDNFSKYSYSLDREFKEKSLKSLISSLKKYKPIEKENFIERFYKKYPYQFEEKKIIEEDDSMFEYINELKEKREREREKEKEKEKEKGYKSNNDKDSEKNINQNPDSLRYNPNYDSIFKKIPGFKMVYNKKEDKKFIKFDKKQLLNLGVIKDKKIDEKNQKDKNKLETENNKLFTTNIKINNLKDKTNNNRNIHNLLNLPQISFKENGNNRKYNTIENKTNFHNYSSKLKKYNPKNLKLEPLNNNKIFEHIFYNNNKIINFGKMSSRNDKFLINTYSLDVPSFGKYSPKYTYIENNAKNIKFSPFGENKKSKKFLLKKMMSSYNVPTEYQFIDNKKLTTDNDLINQQLILKYNIYPSN